MGSRNLRQQPPLIAGHPRPHNDDALSATHDAGLGLNFPFTLISQQCGMQVNGQGKAFSICTDFCIPDGHQRGGNIRHPQHGTSMNRAERIEYPLGYRHSARYTIVFALLYKEFNIAAAFGSKDVFFHTLHFCHLTGLCICERALDAFVEYLIRRCRFFHQIRELRQFTFDHAIGVLVTWKFALLDFSNVTLE